MQNSAVVVFSGLSRIPLSNSSKRPRPEAKRAGPSTELLQTSRSRKTLKEHTT
jgi:hypothetical protein